MRRNQTKQNYAWRFQNDIQQYDMVQMVLDLHFWSEMMLNYLSLYHAMQRRDVVQDDTTG